MPAVDRLGLVTDECYGDAPRDAGLLHGANGGAAQIVEEAAGHARWTDAPLPEVQAVS